VSKKAKEAYLYSGYIEGSMLNKKGKIAFFGNLIFLGNSWVEIKKTPTTECSKRNEK